MRKILFETHHLYYLPNFIPIIETLTSRGVYDLYISMPQYMNERELKLFYNACSLISLKIIKAGTEENRIGKIKSTKFDVIIVGNVGQLAKIVSDSTIAVMVYHGNGWAVRYIGKHPNCKSSSGIDGSDLMIKKAKKLDSNNQYFLGDLLKWKPINKVDAVISMEVLYYFENPLNVLRNIFNNWLNKNGKFVMGIDFYYENPDCHDWQEKTGVSIMNLMKINEWEKLFIDSGFSNVKKYQFCSSGSWKGTLVIEGTKINI